MKPHRRLRAFLAGSSLFASVCSVQAQTQYYYDNLAGAGFGSAGSTWGTNNVISTDPTGTVAASNTVTNTNDTLNLGTDSLGLGAGTITVNSRSIGSIVRGAASNTGIIALNSSTITFAANGIITSNATDAATTLAFGGTLAGGGTSMTYTTAGGTISLTGSNSYAGATIIGADSILRIGSIANGGGNSTLGSSSSTASNLVFHDGATLRYDGGNGSTNRNFTINGTTAQIYARGSSGTNLTWNGTASFGTPNQAATLSLNSLSTNGSGTFTGLLADNGSGKLSLRKIGTGTWTMTNANTFSGTTTVTGGQLHLSSQPLALQNSVIDTTNSSANFLVLPSTTSLTLGGLDGNKNFNAGAGTGIFINSGSGFTNLTALTLNPGEGTTASFSGIIGIGNGSMTLTKTGLGTQILSSSSSTYTGGTTVSNGILGFANGSLGTTGNITVNGGTLRWESGNTQDVSSRIVMQNSGSATLHTNGNNVTFANSIGSSSTSSFTKAGDGTLTLNGGTTYTGTTNVTGGRLIINGASASTSMVVTGSLGGSGVMASATLSGSGSIDPGNSPGIMTASATDPSGGLDYNFEFEGEGVLPIWNTAGNSTNDVLRLTGSIPFDSALTSANVISIYLNVGGLALNDVFTGGFYTDESADFLASIQNATFQYFLADPSGLTSYMGNTYTAYTGPLSFSWDTVSQTADFGAGDVTGFVTQFTAIPEPGSVLLGGVGALLLLRRRRSA